LHWFQTSKLIDLPVNECCDEDKPVNECCDEDKPVNECCDEDKQRQ
jgi:hypothetical protein